MMQARFEQDLHERFARLRADVDGLVPPFTVPAVRRPAPKVRVVWAAAAAAAVLLTVVGTWYVSSRGEQQIPYAINLAATTWEAPTDFLLATPGSALLGSVPVIEIGVPVIVEPAQQAVDTSI